MTVIEEIALHNLPNLETIIVDDGSVFRDKNLQENSKISMELFIILELTKDEEVFNCDKELNRICGYDESWGSYYLLTADDVESIKYRLGDRVITLKDEYEYEELYEELKKGKYHILSADEAIGHYEESNAWDDELERWNDCYGNGEFLKAMDEKYDGGYYEDVRRRAFEKSRILEGFTNAINEIWEDDYDEWWSANMQTR